MWNWAQIITLGGRGHSFAIDLRIADIVSHFLYSILFTKVPEDTFGAVLEILIEHGREVHDTIFKMSPKFYTFWYFLWMPAGHGFIISMQVAWI